MTSSESIPDISWDDTPCPLCGHRDEELILEAPDPTPSHGLGLRFAVVRCRNCDLHYTNPRPDAESIGQFYPTDYRPHRRPRKLRHAGARRSWLARLTGRSVPERDGEFPMIGQGRLLDFGCGGGGYMKRMAEQGWKVTGLDSSVGAVRTVLEELGLTALVGTLPHPDLQPGSFDVITMWHSIEHVHQPVEILREAFKLLTPGGKIIIACPRLDSWAFRRFGPSWFALDLPRHVTHFTPKTLSQALTISGFRIESVRTVRHSDWLRSTAKLDRRSESPSLLSRLFLYKPFAKFATWLIHLNGGSDVQLVVAERPV